MKLPIEWYIALRYIRSNVRQSAIIALAVGIGVSIIIFIPSVNLSFFNDLVNKTVRNNPHIRATQELDTFIQNQPRFSRILPPGEKILYTDKTATRRRNIKAYRRMMKEIQLIPGVASVAPYIDQQIIIVRGSKVMGAELRGIIPEEEKNISTIENDVLKGNLDSLTTDQIFLGWRLAKELEATMGDRVQLVTAYGTRSFKVTGLMKSGLYQQDMTRVLINLQTAQDLLKMSNEVTGISVSIYDIYQAPEISRAITAVTSLKTRNWMEDNEIILQQIQNFKVIFGFISFMIIFSAASSITSVLIMVVASKSKEIGILKSMGMTAASIIKMFLLQAMFLSLLGAIVGIFGGMGIIAIYNATPMAKGETFIGIAREPAHISIEYTFRAIFYAMLSSFLASLIPAWQAGRLDPVKNINQ